MLFKSSYLITGNVTSRVHEFTTGRLVGSELLTLYFFVCCPIMCLYVLSSLLWCPLRFPHKTMFDPYLPPFVCRWIHVLFTLYVFTCVLWYPTYIVLCFLFVFLLCAICCRFIRIVHFRFPCRYSLRFFFCHCE